MEPGSVPAPSAIPMMVVKTPEGERSSTGEKVATAEATARPPPIPWPIINPAGSPVAVEFRRVIIWWRRSVSIRSAVSRRHRLGGVGRWRLLSGHDGFTTAGLLGIGFPGRVVGVRERRTVAHEAADSGDAGAAGVGQIGLGALGIIPSDDFARRALYEWMFGRALTRESDRGNRPRHVRTARVHVGDNAPRQTVMGVETGKKLGLVIRHFGQTEVYHARHVGVVQSDVVAICGKPAGVSRHRGRWVGCLLDGLDCCGDIGRRIGPGHCQPPPTNQTTDCGGQGFHGLGLQNVS